MAVKTRKKYTSKGIHSTVSRGICQSIRADRTYLQKLENISIAWKQLKNPWITIPNPDKSATNRRFIKVKTNTYWGNPKPKKEATNEN